MAGDLVELRVIRTNRGRDLVLIAGDGSRCIDAGVRHWSVRTVGVRR